MIGCYVLFLSVSPFVQEPYHRAVRRKARLEDPDEEKTKTGLKRRKANVLSRKKPVWALPDVEKPVSLFSDKKSQFAPSPDEKLQQPAFRARKKIEIS